MNNPWADPWGDSKAPSGQDDPSTTPSTPAIKPQWEAKESVSWIASPHAEAPAWRSEEQSSWNSPHSSLNGVFVDAIPASSDASDISSLTTTADDIPPSPFLVPLEFPPPFSRTVSPSPEVHQDLDVDGFGGFESGLDSATTEEVGGWSPSLNPLSQNQPDDEDGWGNSWEASTSQRTEDEQPDEWEAAQQRKLGQDKHVPPELLENVLARFGELSTDLWKEESLSEMSINRATHRSFDSQSLNLNSCREKVVPEQLSLPLPLPFSQSFASKRLVESLKLTRHARVSQMGPTAMYMASKGSTSWEASVKAKAEISDVSPPGWKILPREESPRPEQSQKRTPVNGGILSFFTRRSTNPSNVEPLRSASPAKSVGSLKTENNSPRPSIDIPATQYPSQAKDISSRTASPTRTFQPASTQLPSQSVVSPTTSKGLDEFPDDQKEATSTMSRFLGRFTRSFKPSISQRDSISLSADDLEYLSDVVPIAQEDGKEDAQIRALASMITSSPLPATLPPPLAPPPLAPQPMSARPSTFLAHASASSVDHDLFSVFETPALPDKPAANTNKQLQPLPSIPFTNSAHHQASASVGSKASTALSPSTSFSGFLDSSPSIFRSSSVPPPIPPPKASETFFVPIGSTPSTIMSTSMFTSRSTTPNKSSSIPALQPPPSSTRVRPHTTLQAVARTPLPTSRSDTPASRISTPFQPTINEDDEFSDFITSPSNKPNYSHNPMAPGLPTPVTPTSSSSTSNASRFDEFEDFFTPTPPTQKPGRATHNAVSLPQSRASSPPQVSPRSNPRVSRAEHQRTISLLEIVATRGDKWLSPPSPLPVALPPPNAPTKAPDLMSGIDMQTQQTRAIVDLPAPVPAQKAGSLEWNFPAPPVTNSPQPKAFSPPPPAPSSYGFNSSATPFKPKPPVNSVSPASSSKPGGLSAQDLAFFEGL